MFNFGNKHDGDQRLFKVLHGTSKYPHTHGHRRMVWREVKELLAYVQKLREETGAWAMIEPGVSQSHNQTAILMSEGKNKKPWFPVI